MTSHVSKRARLADLGRKSHVSDSALSTLIAQLHEEGLLMHTVGGRSSKHDVTVCTLTLISVQSYSVCIVMDWVLMHY